MITIISEQRGLTGSIPQSSGGCFGLEPSVSHKPEFCAVQNSIILYFPKFCEQIQVALLECDGWLYPITRLALQERSKDCKQMAKRWRPLHH